MTVPSSRNVRPVVPPQARPLQPSEEFRIVEGQVYIYKCSWPRWAKGHRYRVECFARMMPVNCRVVVLQGLTGPDAGKFYTCSLANFSTRYLPLPEVPVEEIPADPEPPEKVLRYAPEGKGSCL